MLRFAPQLIRVQCISEVKGAAVIRAYPGLSRVCCMWRFLYGFPLPQIGGVLFRIHCVRELHINILTEVSDSIHFLDELSAGENQICRDSTFWLINNAATLRDDSLFCPPARPAVGKPSQKPRTLILLQFLKWRIFRVHWLLYSPRLTMKEAGSILTFKKWPFCLGHAIRPLFKSIP